jgi:hypothetical protein
MGLWHCTAGAGPSPGVLAAAIIVPVVVVAASVAAAACWLTRSRSKRGQQKRGGSSSKTDLELGLVDSGPGASLTAQDLGGDLSHGSSAKLVSA